MLCCICSFMTECQSAYIADALKQLVLSGKREMCVRQQVFDDFNAHVQQRLGRTVWGGSCSSW
jgi:hypothetical protein